SVLLGMPLELTTKAGARVALGVGFDTDENKSHRVEARGETHRWTGPYHLFPSRTNEEEGN
ncbi:MAG: hypothetical protein AAFY04_07605, partial [Pseudomonadota bacterium]